MTEPTEAILVRNSGTYSGEIWLDKRPFLATVTRDGDAVRLKIERHPDLWTSACDDTFEEMMRGPAKWLTAI